MHVRNDIILQPVRWFCSKAKIFIVIAIVRPVQHKSVRHKEVSENVNPAARRRCAETCATDLRPCGRVTAMFGYPGCRVLS